MAGVAVEVIRFRGFDFTVVVPAAWARLATPRHLVVFLGEEHLGIRSSIAVSRFAAPLHDAALSARDDHLRRFRVLEVLHESVRPAAVYRRYLRDHTTGARLREHQLFGPGLLVTCSRLDASSTDDDERAFGIALRTFAVSARQSVGRDLHQDGTSGRH